MQTPSAVFPEFINKLQNKFIESIKSKDINEISKVLSEYVTTNSTIAKLIHDQEKIIKIYNSLKDEKSKSIYCAEILKKSLCGLIDNNIVNKSTQQPIRSDIQLLAKKFVKENKLDNFIDNNHPSGLDVGVFSMYQLRQYAYDHNDNPLVNVSIKPEDNDICIDAGACYGDATVWMAKECNVKKVYSFEPVPDTFQYLCKNIEKHNIANTVIPVNMGLSDQESMLHMQTHPSTHGADTLIFNYDKYTQKYGVNEDIVAVKCTSIDKYCKDNGILPTFIKMDIEGAEKEALMGAKETIRTLKPKLAISAYHLLDDIYEIPLLLLKFNPNYQFYYKKVDCDYELVLFAINKD